MRDAKKLWDSGYSPTVPFVIELPGKQGLICNTVVRAMPGRRFVFSGQWQGKPVYIKVFADNARAVREWQAEQHGIHALHEAAIAAPEIIYSISLSSPAMHILVYEEVPAAESARDRWLEGDEVGRRKLLGELVVLLAAHHAAGICQHDMHFQNFIYSKDVLYTLDAADINISPTGLFRQDALDNLASLLALADAEHDSWIHDLYLAYISSRGWEINAADEQFIQHKVRQGREYKLRKYLLKIFRNCSAFISSRNWRKFYVYDRDEDDADFRAFITDPDHLPRLASRKLIKNGNTCTVTEVAFGERRFVCKRYNIKSIWHAINRGLRPTRAAQSWRNAHRLMIYRVATASPVALIEQRFGPLRGKAWFIMRSVPGPRLSEYMLNDDIDLRERGMVVGQFVQLLKVMCREQMSHGDMKASNFIINDGKLVVVDLDSLRVHQKQSDFERAFGRDLRRFLQNWNEAPALNQLFREAIISAGLQNYLPSE